MTDQQGISASNAFQRTNVKWDKSGAEASAEGFINLKVFKIYAMLYQG
jgi:hypothetical protein